VPQADASMTTLSARLEGERSRPRNGWTVPDAMTALMNYDWPGNVRELEHAVERAVIVARGTSLRVRELPPEVSQKTRARVADDSLDLHAQERIIIERALERFRGNRRRPPSR
jgi:DNA-binding NtrC family response regulator